MGVIFELCLPYFHLQNPCPRSVPHLSLLPCHSLSFSVKPSHNFFLRPLRNSFLSPLQPLLARSVAASWWLTPMDMTCWT